jgi:hypothetical protein
MKTNYSKGVQVLLIGSLVKKLVPLVPLAFNSNN